MKTKEENQKLREQCTQEFIKVAHDYGQSDEIDKENEAIMCFYKGKNHMETVSIGSNGSFEELFANLFKEEPRIMSAALHAASRSIPTSTPDTKDIANALKERIESIFKGKGPKVEIIDGTQIMKDLKKEVKPPTPMGESGEA